MKRVQAIVSGRKKQCTKLPTPSQPVKVKGKKSRTSPAGLPEGSTRDKKGKTPVQTSTDGVVTTTTPTSTIAAVPDSGGVVAVSASSSTPPSSSVAPIDNKTSATTRAAAPSTTTTNSGNRSPGSRTPSRIPASSPKKGRDASGTPSGKGRLRLDSEEKPKKKPSLIRKLSLKDKHKSESLSRSKSDRSETGGSSTGHVSSGEDSRSRKASRSEVEVQSQMSVSTRSSSDSRTITPQPSQSQISDSSSQLRGSDSTLGKGDTEEMSDGNKAKEVGKDGTVISKSSDEAKFQQRSNGPITVSTGNVNGHSASAEHHYGSVKKTYPAAVPMHRDSARYQGQGQRPMVPGDHSRPNGDTMMCHQGYVSLPRSSRATTPTAEDIYSHGTLPRRSNSSTPIPQSMAYQNHIYGTVRPTNSWGTLSRESSSDSGFNVPSYHDRGRPGRPPVNGNYYAGYPPEYHRLPRAGSVPPHGTDGPESIYSLARSDSVPPVYYSDGEYGRYQPPRATRAGSVPLGYESESSAYAEGSRGMVRNYESDSGNDERPPGLRVGPGDERYRAGPGKRPIPRRHTLGVSNKDRRTNSETERKREAFMNLLAQRYPQYADRIQGSASSPTTPVPQQQQQQQQAPIEKPARARDSQRRRTAVVSYDPAQATNTLEYDDLGTMSDLELPSFQRGNFMRTSLPVVRSASTSLERPLGLVFLVYRDQTKKSLLPNEITTLDTVRALFVRAFSSLTMEMMEETRKKIYILDKSNNIYFQLEDLAEIVDRSVLKLHDTDNEEPQRVRERQEVRGRTVQMPLSRPQSRQGHPDNPDFIKAHSLPPQASSQDYQDLIQDQRHQYDMERRSRSRTPEPTERPRYSHSPDRLPTPERGPLNPIPENRQLNPGYREPGVNYYETIGPASPGAHRGPYPSGTYEAPTPGQYHSYPVSAHAPPQQAYIARSTRAATMMHPQRAMGPIYDTRDASRGSNPARHSLAFAPSQITPVDGTYQRSQSYHIPSERDKEYARLLSAAPGESKTKNRIEKMEAQLANLTAWVHYQKSDSQQRSQPHGPRSLGSTASDSSDTFPASSASSLSDIPDGHKPPITPPGDPPNKAVPPEIGNKLSQLKLELHTLKRQQQLNMEVMREEFMSAFSQIKTMCSTMPGAENQVHFHKRNDMTENRKCYLVDKGQVTQELIDLESTVEELRGDVISRKCRVNINDVEGMALLLSNITKNLADLKTRFPELQDKMKHVMEGEMRVVISEEKFLKEEPVEIDGCLKRCKKLTETLYTLKRLASVQDHRPHHIPNVNSADGMADTDQKKMLLENIRAMVPDHDQRVQQMEAADASRERKKKISVQQEALKFGKTLEIASKALRPPSTSDDKSPEEETDGKDKPKSRNLPNDGHILSRSKSPVTIIPVSSAPTHPPVYSHPLTSTVSTGIATSVIATSIGSAKPSFSSTLTSSAKPAVEKQEVKESAINSVSQTQQMHSKPSYSQPASAPLSRSATLPLTHTTERLSSHVQMGTGPVAPTVTMSEASKRVTNSSGNTHSIRPPVYSKPNTMGPLMRKEKEKIAPLADKEDLIDPVRGRPKSSPGFYAQTNYPKAVSAKSFDDGYQNKPEANGQVNGHSNNDEKQAAIPAIYNSVNSPTKSSSTSSPSRNSIVKVAPSGMINLMLSGTVSPKSPTAPGTFNISPPIEIISPSSHTDANPTHMPSTPVKRDTSFSDDSASTSGSPAHGDANTKQKKVPPPPPPRKGSRPTSVSGMPTVNGGADHSQQQDSPQFVGGILGQHRLSGGPLSSTPKAPSQQRTMSTFEKDIAAGIYANLNRPDLQSQNSSPQQMINQVASSPASSKGQENLLPSPSVTSNSIDREERGSSSESTSSSSGTSMGSQQSVVNIMRTGSLNVKATKLKPEPPRRQSSLLSKSTCPGRDTLVHDRKKTLNGVDL